MAWRRDFEDDYQGAMMSGWRWSESPLVDGDKVVCTPGGARGAMIALDKRTGDLVWRCEAFTDKAGYASIVIMERGGVRQYVQLTGQSLAGVHAETGSLLWQADRPGKTAVITTPVFRDGLVFVTSAYGVGCNLFNIPDRTKERSWPHPVVANGKLYLRDQGLLLCYKLTAE